MRAEWRPASCWSLQAGSLRSPEAKIRTYYTIVTNRPQEPLNVS
jgi:hypothetical protein